MGVGGKASALAGWLESNKQISAIPEIFDWSTLNDEYYQRSNSPSGDIASHNPSRDSDSTNMGGKDPSIEQKQ